MHIKILGKGCKKCQLLEDNVKKAVESLGFDATIEKVTDINAIADHGILATPGLIVDDEIKLVGRVASAKKLETLLQ